MQSDEEIWWIVMKVYHEKAQSYTNLNKFGKIDDIIQELEDKGAWVYVDSWPEEGAE